MSVGRVSVQIVAGLCICFLLIFAGTEVRAQDVQRQTVAVAYPLDESVIVKFRGMTVLPR